VRAVVTVGVVSDTHLPKFGRALPVALVDGLREANVELILHLGDFTGSDVPALFEAIAPFDAVAGNNDGAELVQRFARRKVVDVHGVRFGLVHGDEGFGANTPERARRSFGRDEVDVVLFGHSHMPLVRRLDDGRWLVNPGSPTDKRSQSRYSFALIDIDTATRVVSPRIVYYDDRATERITAPLRTSPSR
jgi:putative phosphoesterase